MKTKLFILLLLILTLTACSRDPNLSFIQGAWESAPAAADNKYLQWQFNNGTFSRQQQIDTSNLLYTTGQYRLVESDGDLLILELFDFSGDRISYENSPMTIRIEIDRANDTARITNTLFNRVSP
jgi:hypothetical protein